MSTLLDVVTGWILFGGIALALGALVANWVILPRAAPDENTLSAWRNSAAGVGTSAALLILVGVALYFVRQLRDFRDPFVPWTEDAQLLLRLDWGRMWTGAAAAAVALLAALGAARRGRAWGWVVATPLALALGLFPGLTGHAGGAERWKAIYLLADGLHVWAAGAWIGGLALVLHLDRASLRADGSHPPALPRLVPAFSTVAMASVATLALTGLFAAWSHVESVSALVGSAYGRWLLVKLVLVAIVLALGARNFRILTPRLETDDGNVALRASALTELLVAQLVLAATAILVRTSPLGG